ncbi:lantibiotic dehydratase [Lentzea sp. NPDC004789]
MRTEEMDDWRWWKQVLVRGSGFPADGVLLLADEELARRADALAGEENPQPWQDFRAEFDRACTVLSTRLQSIAERDDFLRAVTWQNHRLVDGAIRPFLRWDAATDNRHSKHRQREELIANYWQRYCVKNDTIGFFGPSGWGVLHDGDTTRCQPGKRLLRSSDVFFEAWAVDRLAEAIEELPSMNTWLMPRRLSFVRMDGDEVVPPIGPRVRLSPEQARVLRLCDGKTRAHDFTDSAGLDLEAVLSILDMLRRRRWIAWKLELPIGPWPERDLRTFLGGVDDDGLRGRALDWLDSLEAARDRVRNSDSADALADALTELDTLFGSITGASSTRNEGRTYGGRTLVYHDSSRDLDITVGRDLLDAARPLTLLGRAARWFCWRLGQEVRETLRNVYNQAVTKHGGPVDLSTVWFESLRPLHRSIESSIETIEEEFAKKWAAIVTVPDGTRTVSYSYDELLPLVTEAFSAPGPGWAGARYFCPDMMVSAADINALRDGDFELVLGEVHMAINTVRSYCFVTQHPDENELLSSVDQDFPQPRLLMVLPKESPPRLSVRTHPALIRDRDLMVEFSHHTVAADRPTLVLSRDVAVHDDGEQVVVQLPGGETFELIDVFAEMLMGMVIDRFQLFADRPYMPRVSIDRLIVARESWRFASAELAFATGADEVKRFVNTRAWAAEQGMPRHVFVKSKAAEKPVYVDFASPFYVNALAKMIRRTSADERLADKTITFVEMSPTHDDLWLTDHEGHRYTSELRFTWVDDRVLGSTTDS